MALPAPRRSRRSSTWSGGSSRASSGSRTTPEHDLRGTHGRESVSRAVPDLRPRRRVAAHPPRGLRPPRRRRDRRRDIGARASVWPCAVLRGDYGTILVGDETSIQDGTVVHAVPMFPTVDRRALRRRAPRAPRGVHPRGRVARRLGLGDPAPAVVGTGATVGANAVVPERPRGPARRARDRGARCRSVRAARTSRSSGCPPPRTSRTRNGSATSCGGSTWTVARRGC